MKYNVISLLCLSNLISNSKQIKFIDPNQNQLRWLDYKNPDVVDGMEWGDEDINFTRTHPDWGADENVKQYFRDAENRPKRKEYKF